MQAGKLPAAFLPQFIKMIPLIFLPLVAVIEVEHAPIVAFRLIREYSKGGVVKHKTWPAGIRLNRNSQNGIQRHVQNPRRGRPPDNGPENDQEYVE